jgi:hypothetical protein
MNSIRFSIYTRTRPFCCNFLCAYFTPPQQGERVYIQYLFIYLYSKGACDMGFSLKFACVVSVFGWFVSMMYVVSRVFYF